MSEYDREVFSRYSKEDLLTYIEQQNEQVGRLETRFRDVLRAYKGALKEKEALEATVKALSIQEPEPEPNSELPTDNETDSEAVKGEESGGGDVSESGDVSDSGVETRSADQRPTDYLSPGRPQLKQQLSALTTAMATLTEEKSKMETSFQQDKKAMKAQQDTLSKQLASERDSAKKESKALQQQIEEVRDVLRNEQRSRQDEQETNGQMLRELQALIAIERDHKEALKLELEEVSNELQNVREKVSQEKVQEYEELLNSLCVELEQVKGQLAVATRQDSSPEVLKLKREMVTVKEECGKTVAREQEKLADAESRLQIQSQREESRVAGLEARLSSLSETIGGYDRLRENDQATIQKLKERVAQLDSENTTLTRESIEREGSTNAEMAAQITTLQDKLARLKGLLKVATMRLNEGTVLPTNVEELSVSDYNEMLSSRPSGKECQQELTQLKEEFERYKTRAQSVLRTRGESKDNGGSHELEDLRRVNEALMREVDNLRAVAEEESQRHSEQLQELRGEMREMDTRHRAETASAGAQYKGKLQELETQVQATRARTLRLMKEKDNEILKLKTEASSDSPRAPRNHPMRLFSRGSTSSLEESNGGLVFEPNTEKASLHLSLTSADSSNTLNELLDKSSPAPGGRRLLHEVQEQEVRDSELAAARRKRLELEDLNRDLVAREQRHFEQIAFLKGEIRKLGRDRSRETESMEYLKNIIMHYMCADSAGRDQLISPIATVLHFSSQEVSEVKKKIASRRWLTAAPK